MKKNIYKNLKKKFCVIICKGYVPMGIFPNRNIHTNIDCHLKI